MCDTTHSNTHSHVRHDSFQYTFTRVTRLIQIHIHMCDKTHSNTHTHVWYDSFTYSFTCVTRLILWLCIHNCDITPSNTHSYVRHDLCVEQHESLKKLIRRKRPGNHRAARQSWGMNFMAHLHNKISANYAFYAATGERRGSIDPWGYYELSPILQVYFRESVHNYRACNYRALLRGKDLPKSGSLCGG